MAKKDKKIRGVFEKIPGCGEWWIQYFDADGRRRREKVGTKANAEYLVQKRRIGRIEGAKLPENLRKKPVLFSEIAADALTYSEGHKRRPYDDRIQMRRLVEVFGTCPADSVTPAELERWFASHEHWTPATRNRWRSLLSLTYRLGMQNGKVGSNPARLVKRMREDNGRIRFLSQSAPDEESRLRAAIADKYPQHLPDYLIALNTGARPSEQFSLTWRDIDLNRKLLTISRSKTGHSRHIPLNAVALMAFEGLLANSNGAGRVFAHRGYKHWFDRAVADAGIENFTWYCLRHTFASRLVMAGVDLRTVAELMGHRTIQMTMRYAHLSPDHTLAAVRHMDEMFGPTATSTATSDFKGAESSSGRIN